MQEATMKRLKAFQYSKRYSTLLVQITKQLLRNEILVWCISSVASSVLSVKGKKRRWRLSREIKNEISVSSRGQWRPPPYQKYFHTKYKKNNGHCRRQYCLFLSALWQLIFRHSAKIFWCLSINKSDPQDLRFILDQGIDSYINNTYAPSLPPP